MALSNNTTSTNAGASAFFSSLFAARSPVSHTDDNETEITDWEFVNNTDLSDDDIIDILSDSESENSSTLISVSFLDNCGMKIDDQDYGSLDVVAIRSAYGAFADEKKKLREQEKDEDLDEEVEDPESDDDEEEYNDDLDDELVPWSVSDRFGRQRMRKLGTRSFAKMNKTTKKFAYTVNRPGCVRGKHGLGRNA